MRVLALIMMIWALLVIGSGVALAEDKFFNSNGVRLRYVEQGKGEAVVLLHGNGGWVESNWGEPGVIDALAKHYRVIAIDCRGYGKSDKPHEASAYGSNMGEDVIRLLDHLRIRRAHVVGYSMGARITSWLIVNRPTRLISATLGASTYYVDTPEQRKSFETSAKQAEADTGPEAVRRENPGITEEWVARVVAMNDPLAKAAVYRGYPGLCIKESALHATKIPVLHIIGSLDTSRLPASRHFKEKVLPSAEFLIVEGATHAGTQGLFRRREFVDAIERFLRSHR